ncbi:MAG: hypothetical protein RQ739_15785 [Desulfotignum sp.]|nr:hypothetical protein [Desulfotignum sp.]
MSCFKQYLAAVSSANSLGHDTEWLFYPGMLPDSRLKWWGNFGSRPAAHEGIDICFYRAGGSGLIRSLPAGARVPAWSSGTVINMCGDFLGTSLVMELETVLSQRTRILEIYSHLTVGDAMTPGTRIHTGQIIARITDTRAKGSVLPPHLHLSCIEVPAHIPADKLDWSLFARREKVNVLHPVFMG